MGRERFEGGARWRRGARVAFAAAIAGLAASRPSSAVGDVGLGRPPGARAPVALGPAPPEAPHPGASGHAAASTGPVSTSPLALAVHSDTAALDQDALRLALEDELQWYVVPVGPEEPLPASVSRISVDLRAARGELSVRYDEPGRRPLVRVIPAPSQPEATIRTVAWLVGNLVRDQTSELIGQTQQDDQRDDQPAAPPPPFGAAPPPAAPMSPAPATAREPATSDPAASVAAVAVAQPPPLPDRYAFATASFIYPFATNAGAPSIRTRLSLNLIYGRVGMLDRGVQIGTANSVLGAVDGAQVGLVFNHAGGDVRGLQAAVGGNVASSDVRGLQVAIGTNRASGDLEGVQVAVVNTTRGHVRGAQAGFVNDAGDVNGAQVGIVNVGRQVRGVQLGLVNVSDDIRGVPIGLINVSRAGGVHPAVWTSGTTQLAVGVKFATRNMYTLFSGATHQDRGLRLYGPGLAVGARAPFRWLILESDLGGTYLFGGPLTGVSRQEGLRDDIALGSWRLIVSAELHRRFTLFAGAALTGRFRFYQVAGTDVSYEIGPDFFAGVQL